MVLFSARLLVLKKKHFSAGKKVIQEAVLCDAAAGCRFTTQANDSIEEIKCACGCGEYDAGYLANLLLMCK